MTISILDSTLTGLAAGGLPAGVITSGNLESTGRLTMACTNRNTAHSLGGDSGWVDHLSMSFTAEIGRAHV